MKIFALVVLASFAAAAFGAEMYRWVDEKGTVNYTPYPPPANIRKVETKKLGGNTVQTSEGSYSLQQAAKNFPVTLYVTECGEFCNSARAHLKKRGIPYSEKNPTDPKETEAFKKISGGGMPDRNKETYSKMPGMGCHGSIPSGTNVKATVAKVLSKIK